MNEPDSNTHAAPAHDDPSVAIIMRSKNEQPHTERTLTALQEQTFADFTLHNVDSGSTDGTLEAIKRLNPDAENIVEIAPDDYVPGRVLNRMIARTREPLIVLLNADCVPQHTDFLERLLAPIRRGKCDAVSARQRARDDAHFIVRYDLDRAFGDRNLEKKQHSFFSAAACAFKRELWESEQFPEEGWGEDFVWAMKCKANGARFDIAVDAVVEHSHNYPLKTLYRRERGHGIVHHQMLNGGEPSVREQGLACAKHIVRDVLHATWNFQVHTIPYNIAYRCTCHWAHYQGRKAGHEDAGFPTEFFRD